MPASPNLAAELSKAWRLGTAPLRRLPDFILPGAPKCGTSSLYDVIASHPRVRRAVRKEPTNFVHYPTSALRSRMHHPFDFGDFLTGEASVEYFVHPEAPQNIRAVVPGAKLIFLFRDPVSRAWSDYHMFCKSGHETESFETSIERQMDWLARPDLDPLVWAAAQSAFSPVRYLLNGLYHRVLQNWLAVFPREQCLILLSDDFFRDGPGTAHTVFNFLNLDPPPQIEVVHAREGGYSKKMAPETEAKLRAFFAPHNRALGDFLGVTLPWKT
ncbi:hypothetical protein BH09VER1_BH09VER1_18410 [soil metagenome]